MSESEDNDKGVVSIQAHAASFEDVEKACVTGEKIPDIHVYDNGENKSGVSGDENSVDDLKTGMQQIAGASYAIPVTFDMEHDYVFSAVRVESKLSDEEESLGKENPWSTEQSQVSHMNLIGKLSRSTASSEVEEDNINIVTAMDSGSPRNKKQISSDTVWTDSSDDVDGQKVGFGPDAIPADQLKEQSVENNGSSDVKDDGGSHKWTHRSSQDSLLGCSPKNPGEQQHLLDCYEEASLVSIGRVSDDSSPSLSPVPDKEDETKKQIRHNLDVDSHCRLSKKQKTNLGNDQIDDGHLVDKADSWTSAVKGDVLNSPHTSAYAKAAGLEEAAAVEVDDGSSENCDHTPQKLQDSLGRTAVKEFDVRDGSHNAHNRYLSAGNQLDFESKLNSRIHLESGNAAFSRTEMSSGDLRGQPTTDDVTAVENCDSRRNCTDELLLQTDIDDVDLDSPDEAKSVVERSEEVKISEGPITQVKEKNVRYY